MLRANSPLSSSPVFVHTSSCTLLISFSLRGPISSIYFDAQRHNLVEEQESINHSKLSFEFCKHPQLVGKDSLANTNIATSTMKKAMIPDFMPRHWDLSSVPTPLCLCESPSHPSPQLKTQSSDTNDCFFLNTVFLVAIARAILALLKDFKMQAAPLHAPFSSPFVSLGSQKNFVFCAAKIYKGECPPSPKPAARIENSSKLHLRSELSFLVFLQNSCRTTDSVGKKRGFPVEAKTDNSFQLEAKNALCC